MLVSPSLAAHVNLREILENVAQVEGPFKEPKLALRVAIDAIQGPCWSTKVEGLLAIIRLAAYNDSILSSQSQTFHELICLICNETRNLRSTVARSAIFVLGELATRLAANKLEPEIDIILQALLSKSVESAAFIRDDIKKSLAAICSALPSNKTLICLFKYGLASKNANVRKIAAQFVAELVNEIGAVKLLVGARNLAPSLVPAVAEMASDKTPITRYYGRACLYKLSMHPAFEKLLRAHLSPAIFRATRNIVELVRRRGIGQQPADN